MSGDTKYPRRPSRGTGTRRKKGETEEECHARSVARSVAKYGDSARVARFRAAPGGIAVLDLDALAKLAARLHAASPAKFAEVMEGMRELVEASEALASNPLFRGGPHSFVSKPEVN